MIEINLIPEEVTWHPPENILEIIKAFFDILTVFAFVGLLLIILYSKNKYPIIERRHILWPMIGFSILGIISMAMDALDEFYWFSPKEFYDVLWKPFRLLIFLIGIILLIVTFNYFYQFSERLFGEE
jgi:multisubunit Na+/H+ antiporter MnhB subunit